METDLNRISTASSQNLTIKTKSAQAMSLAYVDKLTLNVVDKTKIDHNDGNAIVSYFVNTLPFDITIQENGCVPMVIPANGNVRYLASLGVKNIKQGAVLLYRLVEQSEKRKNVRIETLTKLAENALTALHTSRITDISRTYHRIHCH